MFREMTDYGPKIGERLRDVADLGKHLEEI
jgi:hypothetical protein